ncbi:hypothetical protein ABB37_08964 [Leptomonas pyrrhocoris]|uniref:Uncharacterized protein n=1 Tax=Leptomonas pyrrhocoris TaxID=157538 RepID=A0A0M9FS74_LEPPY|nr:hypothetical protein ABB37_08964 [Leptomonas pyrrhocoris]KPA75010.1 hypothetical protein ABB37_08964 [Leptomonas pyrrhocoris]|eukprot:XP_015653449.1 hypothetical protein ABB37_08964 [Leptomonas pyrrhocoris]
MLLPPSLTAPHTQQQRALYSTPTPQHTRPAIHNTQPLTVRPHTRTRRSSVSVPRTVHSGRFPSLGRTRSSPRAATPKPWESPSSHVSSKGTAHRRTTTPLYTLLACLFAQ